ncbi:hypothetical protein CJ739_2539 [Mariniflexile rhizosphaerae]|uniref:hypothetical protein n=1 Tax=unclassified Mariniflexile TaxID=2643887 RepID=UPI000CC44B6E|nr:hypothetical protein [Mariniflexile sp. TRM1-10]AXP81612.1 hypothetical protein CJ739_2539 [Mariniflexile sp. TRM1-10]PLB17608.1 MAG: DUF3997 domain containing protein [Flavobacteriaceae bacterium FS1-H7996/R]
MKKASVYIFILSIICFSCSERELGNSYYFLPKDEAIDVGYPEGEAIVYKSNKEYVFSNIRIRGDVLEVHADSKFIIAKRDPLISWETNTGVLEYFIILKKNDSLIGPLTSEKFGLKAEKLGVNLEFE